MEALLLLAQTESIPGGAGWVGAGLLGLVLSWLLLKHLPDKDKQLKDIMDSKDAQIKYLTEKHEAKIESITSAFEKESAAAKNEFKVTLGEVISHCERENVRVMEAFRTELKSIAEKLIKEK